MFNSAKPPDLDSLVNPTTFPSDNTYCPNNWDTTGNSATSYSNYCNKTPNNNQPSYINHHQAPPPPPPPMVWYPHHVYSVNQNQIHVHLHGATPTTTTTPSSTTINEKNDQLWSQSLALSIPPSSATINSNEVATVVGSATATDPLKDTESPQSHNDPVWRPYSHFQ